MALMVIELDDVGVLVACRDKMLSGMTDDGERTGVAMYMM
jgi:hypothetical protein